MKQIKLLLILCVLILLASCRTTESTNSLNITSESKDISSGKEFVSSQPILKDNVNLSMSVFKGVTSIFSEDVSYYISKFLKNQHLYIILTYFIKTIFNLSLLMIILP